MIITAHIRKVNLVDLMGMTAGQIQTLYYLAYMDYEEERKRKAEEETSKKKQKTPSSNNRLSREEEARRKGIRVGARLRTPNNAERVQEGTNPFMGSSNGSFQDLIDELEE